MKSLANNSQKLNRAFLQTGILSTTLISWVGLTLAQSRGGADLKVFYQAWKWVWTSQSSEIYLKNPDRFLYAPGFAWLFSPLASIPFENLLLVWCGIKILALAAIAFCLCRQLKNSGSHFWGLGAWGTLLVVRPVMIDFQYGQVNLLILAAATWAILGWRENRHPIHAGASWATLAVMAASKLYPLPLLALPWIAPAAQKQNRSAEKLGAIAGLLGIALLPFVFVSARDALTLYQGWLDAVRSKGVPTEVHNQSFISVLMHFFSGKLTYAHQMGGPLKDFHLFTLSHTVLQTMGSAWTFCTLGLSFVWMARGAKKNSLLWGSVLIALCIVPSHLIWKPYFVMGMPCAVIAMVVAIEDWSLGRPLDRIFVVGLAFILLNLTSFDIVGVTASVLLEALGCLFLGHLLWILLGVSVKSRNQRSHSISR